MPAYGTVYRMTRRISRKTHTPFDPHIDRRSKNDERMARHIRQEGQGKHTGAGHSKQHAFCAFADFSRNNAHKRKNNEADDKQ